VPVHTGGPKSAQFAIKIQIFFKKYQNFPRINFEAIETTKRLPTAQTLDFSSKLGTF